MTMFVESPWPAIVLGTLLAVMLSAGFLQTGRKALLVAAALGLLLSAVGVWIESRVVTDRESVVDQIHELAELLEQNENTQVLDAIHSLAPEVKQDAALELQTYVFEEVDVKSNLRVEVESEHQPPQIVARFNVVARLKQFPRPIPRYIELVFWKEPDGQWRIIEYDHQPPQAGFMKR